MTSKKRGFIAVSVVVGLGIAVYFIFRKTKKQKIKYLRDHDFTSGSIDGLMELGDDYIDAWYDSAKEGLNFFVLNGTSYDIRGGRSIQPVNNNTDGGFAAETPKAPPLAHTTVPAVAGQPTNFFQPELYYKK